MSKFHKFLYVLNLTLPFVLPLFNIPPAAVGLINHAIVMAEAMGGSGNDKKAAAMVIVSDGINATNSIANKTVIDPSIIPTINSAIDSAIKIVNEIKSATPSQE